MNKTTTMDNPQIGKDVIESLTLGMYEDCRFIYREYIQNAADAVDKAITQNLLQKGEEEIYVNIDTEKRTISILDNATGIPKDNVIAVLRDIAHSTKKRGKDKGFRGIGRLGGLGYCSKLKFETSFSEEPVKTIMTWDAELLKCIINDRENKEEAVEVLKQVTKTDWEKEDKDKHYFRVIMENVTSDELLNIKNVTDYLSMVAPVDISSGFIYRNKIENYMKEHGLYVDSYNIYINKDQIYKPYTSAIYKNNNGRKKKVDDILDVDFLLRKDEDGNIIYWGWYSISCLKGQMNSINTARGIRLRKENIQIGDEEICKKFFTRTGDQRFSFYFFGEIHALGRELIPNSRRDYFSESQECANFERFIKQDFQKLKELCYDAESFRSNTTIIAKKNEIHNKIEEKDKTGYTCNKERDDLHRQLEEQQKKAKLAQKNLDKVTEKIKSSNSPLQCVINKFTPEQQSTKKEYERKIISSQVSLDTVKTKYRTDKSIYSNYNKKERKLISKIYAAITNAIADEHLRETLISKIEAEITK